FPVEMTQFDASTSTVRFDELFLGAPFHPGESSLADYDPPYHFLLDVARDDLWLPDGTPAEMPNYLNGISGCSIWQAIWPGHNLAGRWNSESVRIVGVQTGYYRKASLVKATCWGAVAKVIHEAKPDLRPVLEMHLGPG